MEIRLAKKSDLKAILAIMNHYIVHSTAIYEYERWDKRFIKQWFKEKKLKKFPVYVSIVNKQVVGFATYGTFRYRTAYQFTVENSIYTHPKYTGTGIGTALMTTIIESARASHYKTMVAGIDGDNAESIHFHMKFGFKNCGTINCAAFKFDRWLDLVFLQIIL